MAVRWTGARVKAETLPRPVRCASAVGLGASRSGARPPSRGSQGRTRLAGGGKWIRTLGPAQTHYGSTPLSCPFCHDSRSAKGTHPSATGGPFRPLRKEAERRKCCRAGAVLVWNNRETEMANLVEIKALFLALVGGSPGAEGVFLNQNLAIRSTSVS